MDLKAIFGKYAGQEVPIHEAEVEVTIGKDTFNITEFHLGDENAPVLKSMRETAADHGLTLRLIWPGAMVTNEERADRVNAHIEKAADGRWRITDHFRIG